jgi:hypothetical protein
MVDETSLRPLTEEDFTFAAGPAAKDAVRRRMAFIARRRSANSL